MGPAATIALYQHIVRLTPAKSDQEHIKTIIYCDPEIPDRTNALIGRGKDPTNRMRRDIRYLRKAGADLLIVPCNTAHKFLPKIAQGEGIDFIDMIFELKIFLQKQYPTFKTVGLLATTGTNNVRLYEEYLSPEYTVIKPSVENQKIVMSCIYSIKSKNISANLVKDVHKIAKLLMRQGAQLVVLGCTELSLIQNFKKNRLFIDPLEILAQRAIQKALHN
jgi:aspartate racemase